ncbi:MAG: hypothetical protein AABN34_08765 [Acidobacteriota bacterium]
MTPAELKPFKFSLRTNEASNRKVICEPPDENLPTYLVDIDGLNRRADDVRAALRRFVAQCMNDTAGGVNRSGAHLKELAQRGNELYWALFDDKNDPADARDVREWVAGAAKTHRMNVVIDDRTYIPWGLVYDGDPNTLSGEPDDVDIAHYQDFWCLKYLVSAFYRNATVRGGITPKPIAMYRLVSALHEQAFTGAEACLDATEPERKVLEWLRSHFDATKAFNAVYNKSDLFSAWGTHSDLDMLFFYCHANETSIAFSTTEMLTMDDITKFQQRQEQLRAVPPRSGCLFFMNGCSTAVGDAGGGFLDAHRAEGRERLHRYGDGNTRLVRATLRAGVPLPFSFGGTCRLRSYGSSAARALAAQPPLQHLLLTDFASRTALGQSGGIGHLQQLLAQAPWDDGQLANIVRIEMLTIEKTKAIPKEWPALPYKGLSYYEPADAPLFAGRDSDVIECADLLACSETRILVLHGSTGCGKSSFLRAGLIPFLEHDELGFGFLKDDKDGKLKSILVRSTGKPLVELAKKVCDFARADVTLKKAGGKEYKLNLPDTVAAYSDEEFIEKASNDPSLLIDCLGKMARRLPKTLVLIIDQGEEVITLKPNRSDDTPAQNFFRFVDLFSQTHYDLKLLIALRTEFYGRFVGKTPQAQANSPRVKHYLLDDLTKDQIVRAIERPTSTEPVEGFGVPFEHYKFKYETGLPEKIADELLSTKLAGGILPVMQVVCDTLYQSTKPEATRQDPKAEGREWEITDAAYRALGSIEDQVEKSLNATFAHWCRENGTTSEGDIQRETERWKDVLSKLAGSQSDGTVTTDVVTAEELKRMAAESGCRLDFDKTMAHLVSPSVRILRDTEFFDTKGEKALVRYSLGHDAIGLVLYRWKVAKNEVASAIHSIRRSLRVMGIIVTVVCVVLGAASWFLLNDSSLLFTTFGIALYGVFFIALSYASKVPAFDWLFFKMLGAYAPLIPKKKLQQLTKDPKFLELIRRNPVLYERLLKKGE